MSKSNYLRITFAFSVVCAGAASMNTMSMAVAATPFFHFESNNAANWSTIELDGRKTRLTCVCARVWK